MGAVANQSTPEPASLLRAEVLVEKSRDLVKRFLGLRRADIAVILRMRLAFEHLQRRFDPGLAQLAMHADGVRQQQAVYHGRPDGVRRLAQ